MSFASNSLEHHRIADWTSVVCAALGILVCLVLVVFHGEVKIMKETLESALWCKENPRSNDGMIRKGKVVELERNCRSAGASNGAD